MEPYEQIRKAEKKYCSAAIMIAVCAAIVLIAAGMKPAGKGLILGTIFSIINFIVMGETLPAKIAGTRRRASVLSWLLLLARYAILAIPLVISVKLDNLDVITTIIGLFMIQIVILAEQGIYATTRKNLNY
ncbi:MAG: ATP synthase subunit I [Desulfobacterales bacterium]